MPPSRRYAAIGVMPRASATSAVVMPSSPWFVYRNAQTSCWPGATGPTSANLFISFPFRLLVFGIAITNPQGTPVTGSTRRVFIALAVNVTDVVGVKLSLSLLEHPFELLTEHAATANRPNIQLNAQRVIQKRATPAACRVQPAESFG